MEWSRERRYRKIQDASEEELVQLKEQVANSPWRQSFHVQPETGLLNDPNGFSYFNGEYHLFYQWFPLGPVHGLKYWYHTKSTDLVHWENVGIGIEPTEFYESHGAFSGTAIEHDELLYLFYTGNTRDHHWIRHPYQCIATMDKNNVITKMEQPVIDGPPLGYTDHFRDPAIVQQNGVFYALIGAQRENKTGSIVIYKSHNLTKWEFQGELQTKLNSFGYMWECPGYFELEGKGVLLFSPQGIDADGYDYQNIYQAGYMVGELLDFEEKQFVHHRFHEFDRGFDFYAPQVMKAPNGRQILIGWMGLPEIDYPTDRHGWAHCLTIPRELSLKGDKLYQRPVSELEKLRKEKSEIKTMLGNETRAFEQFEGETYELICSFQAEDAEEVGINLRIGPTEKTVIKYSKAQKALILDRTNSGQAFGEEYGTIRKCFYKGDNVKFQIFVDHSSIEIFVNDGEAVFTTRIFPDKDSTGISFFAQGSAQLEATKWSI